MAPLPPPMQQHAPSSPAPSSPAPSSILPLPADAAGLERAAHELALGLFAIAAAVNRHTALLERVAADGVKVKV